MRMNAYYYSFDKTEVNKIDLILSAVAHAGKAFHHTDQWNEKIGYQIEDTTGSTPVEWIQNAANAAAKEFQRIPELEQRIRELEQQSQRDALDGQAALDEANNRIRELEAERDAAKEEVTALRGALHDHQQMADEAAKREALLVAEVWRCWGLARQTIDDRFLLDMILDNRPAEVRAIVEGKK